MPWINKDATLDEIRKTFSADLFATKRCGVQIVDAGYRRATCSMELTDEHRNCLGNPMGGAIFTLADYCLAVISNVGEEATSSVSSTIEYTSAAKGNILHAEGRVIKSGRNLGFYAIDVHDNLGNHVAHMIATCHRKPQSESR
jgi:acyl-CoA thioesterase